MSAYDYLNNLVLKRANSNTYTQNEETAFTKVCGWINEWKQSFNNNAANPYYYLNSISIETQKSGSRAKGTSLKGKSDIDIFVSITDCNNNNTTKYYYNSLYAFLKSKIGDNDIRKQNVSIGLNYATCDIDVTPGKKVNYSVYGGYQNYNNHNIYSRKKDGLVLTNIQKHIDLVRNSGLQKEIMLLKMWRNCHGLELPSIYIEILATEVFKSQRSTLDSNVWELIKVLRDTVQTRLIIDPANTNNTISDTITDAEKRAIAIAAEKSRNQKYWSRIIW